MIWATIYKKRIIHVVITKHFPTNKFFPAFRRSFWFNLHPSLPSTHKRILRELSRYILTDNTPQNKFWRIPCHKTNISCWARATTTTVRLCSMWKLINFQLISLLFDYSLYHILLLTEHTSITSAVWWWVITVSKEILKILDWS